MFAVVTLFALFASLFTLQKQTLLHVEPFFLVGSRMAFAGIMLLLFSYCLKGERVKLNHKNIIDLLKLSLTNIYLTNIFEIWGLQHMSSGKACLIYSLSPFLAALVAFFVLKECLTTRKWLGMMIGCIGLIPIHLSNSQHAMQDGSFFLLSTAELSVVSAVFCSVYGWILLKKIITHHKCSIILANGISMTIGGTIAIIHSAIAGEWAVGPIKHLTPFLINTLIMCIISNIICYNLYGYLLKKFSATFIAFSGLVTPLFAFLYGYIWLGETIPWLFVLAIILFGIGLTIFYYAELHQKKTITPLQTVNNIMP